MEVYGRVEFWTYPKSGKGDCDDYVLLKRKLLMKRGWPGSALRLTAVMLGSSSQSFTAGNSTGHCQTNLNRHVKGAGWPTTDAPYKLRICSFLNVKPLGG